MFGCSEVIPPKFKDVNEAWIGTDNASWLMRLKKRVQYWFAIGPRGRHWYCRTRELPKTLFVIHGWGHLRYENTDGTMISIEPGPDMYLSRIQIWTRWAVVVQWPLLFFCHWFYKENDVIEYPYYQSDFGIKERGNLLLGYKRDADRWHIMAA